MTNKKVSEKRVLALVQRRIYSISDNCTTAIRTDYAYNLCHIHSYLYRISEAKKNAPIVLSTLEQSP